ncbi:hypothetical protein NEUTE1DRAFT_68071 [Neurospora tetrasperma FGSC 2508]|uniref:Uncharacterized protein n=1 Tax=Neurospora tetrasperma (strain FGSC 2508 / ATCC MYA-4615 / P0657) TaxID=510951 RepID=F8MSZ7_NEUT8|nr:uncharacterized protein NEUTE1DRAFT_68071 [Neurospora tetrasperma FGSC 2508]EGO55979.1 hypothetical protein NEUTE1DRAFT_68071 [Neurospora tetrasperma FGSC 2508]EGZ68760.1 hypothetical protein NEUTE2DRAFT_114591 [Neurospora tetrasperma FGSC 2509]
MQHRTCRYGADCKFSHDIPEFTAEEEDAHEAYLDWRRQLRQMAMHTGHYNAVWTGALAILEDDTYREWQQSVARDLADDEIGGLIKIRQTEKFCMDKVNDNSQVFRVATPFLKVLTHHSLCDSLSVDVYVGKIYRYFGGINGETAILFLSDLARRSLSMLEQEASPPAGWEPDTTCTLLLDCLLRLVRRERKALLDDNVPKLFKDLQKLVALLRQKVEFGPAIDRCTSCLDTMRRLMESATLVLGDPDEGLPERRGKSGPVRLTFPVDIHVPGGSHDNDNADITKIQILPTHGEIISKHPEYLPTTDFLQAHFLQDPVRRHIDTAFRLLRHDTFGPLKDALNRFLADDGKPTSNSHQLMDNNIRAHVYDRAQIQRVFVRPRTGLEAILTFATPHQLRNSSPADRRRWWQESSRLEPGSLACYVAHDDGKKRSLFFIVTQKSTEEQNEDPQKSTLVPKRSDPTITLKLATESQECLALLIRLHTSKHSGVLVDLPGIIPDTFVPVLTNLQRIMTDGELPFSQWILPTPGSIKERPQQLTIPPPAYARKRGFVFKLNSITREGSGPLRLNPSTSHEDIDFDKFEKSTGLNRSQCRALITALTREYALIQGPPGTGKSYVGVQLVRTLLAHKKEASLGPILIICYTNHALDQFLVHLLNCGIEKIIRIGGQSRCEELEGKNLRVVSSSIAKSTVENRVLGEAFNGVEEHLSTAGHCLKPLHLARKGRPNRELLSRYLPRRHPTIWRQFPDRGEVDGEGWTRVGGDSRWILVEFWIKEMIDQQTGVLFESIDGAKTYRQRIDGVHADVNRRAVRQADVVGVTTTGLARNIDMLRRIGSKVIMCEEAAEVMEPHLISAMMPGVEHLIQIGDHRQLRPQIQNYLQFSMETQAGLAYQLDRSQFERRAVGEPGLAPLPVAQLNAQRRMRPEISRLIRRIYPRLEDHPSVLNLPDVVGMRQNLFWLDHEHPEDSKDDGARVKSYSNAWEAEMATALVRHIVRQGEYSSSDIALLTPYTGQLQKLRAALSKDFEVFLSDRDMEKMVLDGFGDDTAKDIDPTSHKTVEKKALLKTIRLATVDNFQGEEAKVIIVSLVRSNMNCKVGFLRTENRINVLLSRAQHGMYLIGNSRTYRNIAMWADVHEQMTEMKATGDSIALCCPRHPDTPIECSEPDDFLRYSPEGGCDLPCDRRLEPCGHQCSASCHSQALHDAFPCPQPCPRFRTTCNHACPGLCGQKCKPCVVKVDNVELPCGHIHNKVLCYRTLDRKQIKCSVEVEKVVPGCGHKVFVECFRDVTSEIFCCPTPCDRIHPCSHPCPGTCGKCRVKDKDGKITFSHQVCQKTCARPYSTCNHLCPKKCHQGQECGSCARPCEVRCPHSKCSSQCQKPCAPCIEKCAWSCQHQGQCTMPCAAPCDRLPCDERCTRRLKCGHQCPSLCGEECPQGYCQICCSRKDDRVDLLEFKTYEEIDLNETPIVVLGCGHFFTAETLDGLVGMHEVYTTDKTGRYNGLKDLSVLANAVPSCPDCKRPIRQFATKRYNRVINRAVMDETSKRFLTSGRQQLAKLEKRLQDLEMTLERNREAFKTGPKRDLKKRWEASSNLSQEAKRLSRDMSLEHQPAKKLLDAVLTFQLRQRAAGSLEQAMDSLNIDDSAPASLPTSATPTYDQQITLGAEMVYIKAEEVVLQDAFNLSQDLRDAALDVLKSCKHVVTAASAAKLPRLVIAASLSYGRIVQLHERSRRKHVNAAHDEINGTDQLKEEEEEDRVDTAKKLLGDALVLCDNIPNTESEREAIEGTLRLFTTEWYEEVTPEELAAIKTAMVSGSGGIATHSGHWYNCANGHPFAIGECGMPMELARCPECNAPIGGQGHVAVSGVTRAENIERA